MMIKITKSCSMGCSHCMNNAQPCSEHMIMKTFEDALAFEQKHGGPFTIITGGEPTEHPFFMGMLTKALETKNHITVTTNGIWLQDKERLVEELYDNYAGPFWQVTNDHRYYPTAIDTSAPVFEMPNVVLCDKLDHLYPQGRTVTNNLPFFAKASKCFNVRAVTKQLYDMHQGDLSLKMINDMMLMNQRFCTPHIAFDGSIRLGESDLCPVCSNIYRSEQEIIQDILNFRCKQCHHINQHLGPKLLSLIGEA